MPGNPRIEQVKPTAAIPGGEVTISGTGFGGRNHHRPQVRFGTAEANLIMAAETYLIARVPEGAAGGAVRIKLGTAESLPYPISLGVQIADNLHCVSNPAVDSAGNSVKPFVTELMNPTGLALDADGKLYVSCRNDGTIHRISPDGRSMQWMEAWASLRG